MFFDAESQGKVSVARVVKNDQTFMVRTLRTHQDLMDISRCATELKADILFSDLNAVPTEF